MISGKRSRPNIVVFFSDQQRWDTLGCYGQKLNVTPNLDKTAKEGVKFEKVFTCQPVCGPARAVVQTGRYATETGCFRNNIALSPDEPTIAKMLAEKGYETAYIGKWHLSKSSLEGPVPKKYRGGYDFFLGSNLLEFTSHSHEGKLFDMKNRPVKFKKYRVDALTDHAIDYLNKRKKEKPFFLFISYLEPHHQNDHKRFEGPKGSKKRFANFKAPFDLKKVAGDWKENYPDYLGACNSLDLNFGRLKEALKKNGCGKNTVILYFSDHGCQFKTRNSEYKRSCHEGSIRIPFIASGPGFAGGRNVRELVSIIDIPPTILAAAGITPPAFMQGRPVQNLLGKGRKAWKKDVFIQISEDHVGRAIRTDRWKYAIRAPGKNGWDDMDSDIYYDAFLYDLKKDPHEQKNLAGDQRYKGIARQLRRLLFKRMKEAGEKAPRIV